MKVVVFGATGGTGRAVIARALADGHDVTAFARDASRVSAAEGLRVIEGDAMVGAEVAPALSGQDAVVIGLGNSQSPFALMFGARRTTPRDICEVGTRNILSALGPGSDATVIVVGAFGTGDTREKLPFMFKLFYRLVLREQMADKEQQDAVLKSSKANYLLVQPVALTDQPATGGWTETLDGTFGKSEVSRGDLAQFILSRLADGRAGRHTITFSG